MESVQVTPSSNKVVGWFQGATRFVVSAREEMDRVTWPSRDELVKATRMIVVFSIILGLAIGFMDLLLQLALVDMIAGLAR